MTDPTLSAVGSLRPALAVAVPLLAALAVTLPTCPQRRATLATGAVAVTFGVVAGTVPEVLAGRVHVTMAGQLAPAIPFSLRADPLGVLFGLFASGLFFVGVPFSNAYQRRRGAPNGPRFLGCLLAGLGAAMGIAFAGNLLVAFAFFELLTLATYPLVAHDETRVARRAGYVYLAYSFTGGLLVLGGLRVVYALSGTVTFVPGGVPELAAAATAHPRLAGLGFGLLVAGFGVRAALVPVHSWLLQARTAPTPVFGLVFAVIVVKAGTFGISRTVLETFGLGTFVAVGLARPVIAVAAVTVVTAALLAVREPDVVVRLTYLTIAGGAVVVVGFVGATPAATAGALLSLVTHGVATLVVFLAICVFRVELDVHTIDDLAGASARLPVTTGAFAVGAASLVSVPTLAGFLGTWYLFAGSVGTDTSVAAVLLVSVGAHVVVLGPLVTAATVGRGGGVDSITGDDGPHVEHPSRTDGGGDTDEASREPCRLDSRPTDPSDGGRIGVDASLLWPLLAATAFLVGFGLFPDRLFVLDVVRIAVESSTGGLP